VIRHLLLPSALALCGCCGLPIGDEVFTVNGSVPPSAQSCDIYLRTEAGDEVPSTRRRVSGHFREDFPVTLCTASYHVVVTCDGIERRLAASKPKAFCEARSVSYADR
jgi:hypothetical protein